MVEYTYTDLFTKQFEQEEEQTKKGVMRPNAKVEPPKQDFMLSFVDVLKGYAGEGADKVLAPKKKEFDIDSFYKEFDDLTLRSAEEAALQRMESGISRSLTKEEVKTRGTTKDPLYGNMLPASPLPKAIEEPSPVTEEELPPAETSGGLMSPITKEEETTPTKEELIASVFKAEGGYSTDTKDKGNYYDGKFVGTNHGISAPILARFLGRTPTVEDMKALTKEEARKIAGNYYYDRFKIDTLPKDVQEIVFHAVYMGESRGIRAMQNLMGLTPDGVMGPKTKEAMKNAKFTKEEFKDEYLRELKEGTEGYSKPSATWKVHGKGWTNRYNKLAE